MLESQKQRETFTGKEKDPLLSAAHRMVGLPSNSPAAARVAVDTEVAQNSADWPVPLPRSPAPPSAPPSPPTSPTAASPSAPAVVDVSDQVPEEFCEPCARKAAERARIAALPERMRQAHEKAQQKRREEDAKAL